MFFVVYGNVANDAKLYPDEKNPATYKTAHEANTVRLQLRMEGMEALYCEENAVERDKVEINRRTGYKAPSKPPIYGKLGIYWHSGADQKTEEFDTKEKANTRYGELLPAKKVGQLAILEARYLVADVTFDDGEQYTYFVNRKYRKGTVLIVVSKTGMKEVKVVRGAYWATRRELEAKCEFGRYKVAYGKKELTLP